MSELLKRLGWLTSFALCAALLGAGCNSEPGDIDDDGVNEAIEEDIESPPSVPSTDMGEMPPPSGEMEAMPSDTPAIEPAPLGEAAAPADEPAPEPLVEPADPAAEPAEPAIDPEPAEPGTEEQPEGSTEEQPEGGDDTNN